MEAFYMVLTLSSLTASQQVLFYSRAKLWESELACERALPRMEGAVARLIQYDSSALELLGTTSGSVNSSYFVTAFECQAAELP